MVDVDFHPRPVLALAHAHRPPRGDVQEATAHGIRLRLELRRAEAARLAADDDTIGNDIGGEAALDHPEIRGGLRVEAAEAHRRYRFRRHLDGREALLGADPRVGGEPVNGEREPIGPGGSRDELGHAVHVQHEPPARPQPAGVEVLGPREPGLLADRQHDLDVAVGNTAPAQDPDRLEDRDDPRLVVAAEDAGPVGANEVAVDDGPDGRRGAHRVHVTGEEEGQRPRRAPGKPGEQIARLATHSLARIVGLDGGAHALEDHLEPAGDGALALGQARDAHEIEELVLQALRVDHGERAVTPTRDRRPGRY